MFGSKKVVVRASRRTARRRLAAGLVGIERLDARLLLSGSPDSTFGTGGLLSYNFGGNDVGYAVAIQSDGRIVAAGTVQTATGTDFGIVRFNVDGSLDTTFGSGGIVTIDFGLTTPSADDARALRIDSSGRIVVTGSANRGLNTDFAIARLNSDGSLDSSFGSGGKVVTNFLNNDDVRSMAIQSDGRILLAGIINNDFGIARFNSDGSIDASFGTGGFVRTAFGTQLDAATSIAVHDDGRISVAGYAQFSVTNHDFALARYNPDGTLDLTLNGTGKVLTNLGSNNDFAYALAVMSDNRVVVAGTSNGNMTVVRYNENGGRDQTFGSFGITRVDLGGANDVANAVSLMSDGKVLIAGAAGANDGTRDFALVRLGADGVLDQAFGASGIVKTDFSGNRDEAFAMAVDAAGRAVLLGSTTATGAAGSFDFGLARYTMDDEPPPNQDPVAMPGGPYSVEEGSMVEMSGDVSFDPDGSIVSYEWDFDYDGSNFTADATGVTAMFDALSLDGPTSRTIALRVTDDAGATHVTTTTIDVTNVAPTSSLSAGRIHGVTGQNFSFSVGISDPATGDTHQIFWDFGDGTVVQTSASESSEVEHTYRSVGVYNVVVTVTDDDGGSSTSTVTVTISPWLLEADPTDPAKMSLWVGGSDGDDVISFKSQAQQMHLTMNGQGRGAFNVTGRIIVFAGEGNDQIGISGSYTGDVEFYGEGGNDTLNGSAGNDTLDGGDGHDLMNGGKGHDLMRGGAGNDSLFGDTGDDTLDGGDGADYLRGDAGNNVYISDDSDDLPKPKGKPAT